jgi:hypothetical protein
MFIESYFSEFQPFLQYLIFNQKLEDFGVISQAHFRRMASISLIIVTALYSLTIIAIK